VGEWALSRQLDLASITATHEGIRGRRRFVRFDFRNGLNHMQQRFPVGIGSAWVTRALDANEWLLH
jgi:hypothetical protein